MSVILISPSVRRLGLIFATFRFLRHSYFHVPIWIAFLLSSGLTLQQALIVEGVYYISRFITAIPCGYMCDHLDKVLLLGLSSFLTGGIFISYYFFPNFYWLFIGQVVAGATMNILTASDTTLFQEHLKSQGRLVSLTAMENWAWAARNLGAAAAAVFGAFVAAHFGLGLPFAMSGVASVAGGAIILASFSKTQFVPLATASSQSVVQLFVMPVFLFVFCYTTIIVCSIRIGATLFQPIMLQYGIALEWFGLILACLLLLSVATSAFFATVSLRKGGIILVSAMIATVYPALCGLGLIWEPNKILAGTMILGALSLHAILTGFFEPSMRAWLADEPNILRKSTALSIAPAVGNFVFGLSTPFIGNVIATVGLSGTLWWLSMATLAIHAVILAFALSYLYRRKAK